MNDTCKICGNAQGNTVYMVKERLLNRGDTFAYLKCNACGALILNQSVENIAAYYPSSYNPFASGEDIQAAKRKDRLLTVFLIHGKGKWMFEQLVKRTSIPIQVKRLFGTSLHRNARILDIGCARGAWLDFMWKIGWKQLTGLDLYCEDDNRRERRWRFISGDIFSIQNERFDCITFNHSFEHMENPLQILEQAGRLLKKGGVCVIAVPLCSGIGWELYKENYCQIDAPRHYFLYTRKSMEVLCQKAGMYIERMYYDSYDGGILHVSDGYKNTDKSQKDICTYFPRTRQLRFREIEERAVHAGKGDEAVFYIKKA